MDIPAELVAAKEAVEFGLLSLPGVVGVGLGAREENEEFDDFVAELQAGIDSGVLGDGAVCARPSEALGRRPCCPSTSDSGESRVAHYS
jgi:hypothetical protein